MKKQALLKAFLICSTTMSSLSFGMDKQPGDFPLAGSPTSTTPSPQEISATSASAAPTNQQAQMPSAASALSAASASSPASTPASSSAASSVEQGPPTEEQFLGWLQEAYLSLLEPWAVHLVQVRQSLIVPRSTVPEMINSLYQQLFTSTTDLYFTGPQLNATLLLMIWYRENAHEWVNNQDRLNRLQ